MIGARPPTQWVFSLCLALILHWNLVNCKRQHDPGGTWILDLYDTKAAIGNYFDYNIPSPPNTTKHDLCYQVSEVGTNTLPTWLAFNESSHTFHGVPLITDKGFYLMKVSLLSSCENASSAQANDVFAIDVDFGLSRDLSKKDILSGVGAKPHLMQNTVQQLSKHVECRRNEIKTLMSVVFDADSKHLNGTSRVSLISKLSLFLNKPLEEFRLSYKHSSVIDKLQADIIIAAGPGNIHKVKSDNGIIVSWPLPCTTEILINQFPKVMARNIASGHLRDTTGYDVINWYISEVGEGGMKVRGRSKREIGMTIVPTPRPSQTASMLSTTSLISVSSTMQSMQISLKSTLLSSAPSSTLLFPTLNSVQISLSSSTMSRIAFSTSPQYVSSMQTSEYLRTLTSVSAESKQPSLSQSPAQTGISNSPILSSMSTLLTSSMQILLSSFTSDTRTNIYSSFQIPALSTGSENSGSSSFSFMSSYATLTSIFPSSQSTNSLFESPSLLHSTNIISIFMSETESPTMPSIGSVEPSVSITSHVFFSQSTAIMSPTKANSLDESSVFPSTLESFEPETSFFMETSSDLRSRYTHLIPSTTLLGTSDIESIDTPIISTLIQTSSVTSVSSLRSTQIPFSSEILTTFLLPSLLVPSSTEIMMDSSATMTSISETSLLTQIYSSSFSTISLQSTDQSQIVSNVMTTALSSIEITRTHDMMMTTTLSPTSKFQSETQSYNPLESSTILFTSAVVSPITLSASLSSVPERSSFDSTRFDMSSIFSTRSDISSSFSTKLAMSSSFSSMPEVSSRFSTMSEMLPSFSASSEISSSFSTKPEISPSFSATPEGSSSFSKRSEMSSPIFPTGSFLSSMESSNQIVFSSMVVTPFSSGMVSLSFVVPDTALVSSTFSSAGIFMDSSSLINAPSTTDVFIESTYLVETLSVPMFPDTSVPLGPSSEIQSLSPTFIKTTELSVSFPSEIISMISSSIETTFVANTIFQTSIISSASALSTLLFESTSTSTPLPSGTPILSESIVQSFLSFSTGDFFVTSSNLAPSISSTGFFNSTAQIVYHTPSAQTVVPSQDSPYLSLTSVMLTSSSVSSELSVIVSLTPSEQLITSVQDTPALSTSSLFSFFSSSATDFPVFSTVMTPSISSVPFVSFAPILSSIQMSYSSLQTTMHSLESDLSSITLFFSEGQSDTPMSSLFVTSTQQFPSSSNVIVDSSFSRSDVLSYVVVQPSMSHIDMLTSFVISSSIQMSTTAQTEQSVTSSETDNISSIVTKLQTISASHVITSSSSETQSLISSLSPQLSTSTLPMSARVSSELLTSTRQVTMSSSSSPTSPPVPSTSDVIEHSSTQILSSSSIVPQLSATPDQTTALSSLPSSDINLPMSSFVVPSSEIQPSPSYSSSVEMVSTPAATTELITQQPETTTEPTNRAPVIQHPIDEIILALGDVLQFSIPEDTFADPEDGLTFDLKLDLLTTDNQPVSSAHWLQLVNNQMTLSGVPLDFNLTVSQNEYLLSATDSEGLIAYDAFIVKVQERDDFYNHEYVITLENVFQNFVDDSQNIVSLCDRVAYFFSAGLGGFSIASVSEGSVVMTYSNKTLATEYCDYEAINSLFSHMAYSNGTPTNAFQDALLPSYRVIGIERMFLNLCLMTTMSPVTNVTESTEPGTNLVLVTVLPACLVSFLIMLCFLVICCCYKRKRGGEEFLLREEKPIYAKNRKPIYLDGELDDKEPRGASHPVILPNDFEVVKSLKLFKTERRQSSREPRPPPPRYQIPDYARVNLGMDDFENNFENDFENDLYMMEPPTYTSQPVLYDEPDHKTYHKSLNGRPPPIYRLPPPYQSQDGGFFHESNI